MSFGNPDLITHIQCKTNIIIMIRGREKIPRLGSMTVIFPKKLSLSASMSYANLTVEVHWSR